MYDLQKLLWDLRRDAELAKLYRDDPDSVLAGYALADTDREALRRQDFKTLYDRGVNPYLLYFFALQIGVDRGAYYANLRGQTG